MFYYQKKGIPSENPFLFRKELYQIEGNNKCSMPTDTLPPRPWGQLFQKIVM